ncbi:MAG: hypothetical protein LBT97_06895 [Planctomycetota bacterium]|nr:hypothetical protein [Planctomycetota bacterium]
MAEKADRIKYLVVAAIAVLIASALVIGWVRNAGKARDAAANNALFKAEIETVGKMPDEAVAVFGKVIDEYAGLPAAEQALISQFALLFYANRHKEAEAPLREHLKNFPASAFAPRIRLALGQTLLQLGDIGGAKRELDSLRNGPVEVVPEARLSLAQALEREADAAGDDKAEYGRRLELAREAYFEIVNQARTRTSFWPRPIVENAEFSLLLVNDKLAGYQYRNPLRPVPPEGGDFVAIDEPPVPGPSGDGQTDAAAAGEEAAPAAPAPAPIDVGAVRPPAPAAEAEDRPDEE